jgi:hypothetical protein
VDQQSFPDFDACILPAVYSRFPYPLGFTLYKEQYLSLFLALFIASTILNLPATKTAPRNRLPWYDMRWQPWPWSCFCAYPGSMKT